MKRRFLCMLIATVMLLAIPVYAAVSTVSVIPSITFNGTSAKCSARITANQATDQVDATMELWRGNTLIKSWSGTDQWTLKLDGTATVQQNKTYTLVINYSVNNVAQTPVTLTKTNE